MAAPPAQHERPAEEHGRKRGLAGALLEHLEHLLERARVLGDGRERGAAWRAGGVQRALEVERLKRQEQLCVLHALEERRVLHIQVPGVRLAQPKLGALSELQHLECPGAAATKAPVVQEEGHLEQGKLHQHTLPRPEQRVAGVVGDVGGELGAGVALGPGEAARGELGVREPVEHAHRDIV